jgi:imidazolonepropionase-like amidohydrolase
LNCDAVAAGIIKTPNPRKEKDVTEEKNITIITNGRLIDGTGADPIENATVVIEGSKIRAAGKHIAIPKDASVMDVSGKTVMPGLINSHIHFKGGKNGRLPPMPNPPRELTMVRAADDARRSLAAGFTTVKDCGGRNAVFLKQAIAEGMVTGFPRIVAAGYLMSHINGMLDKPPRPQVSGNMRKNVEEEALICGGTDGCLKAARYSLRQGGDFIKVLASGSFFQPNIASPDGAEFSQEELEVIVKTAAKAGKFVSVHSQNCQSSKNAILAGVKTIDHASRSDEEVVALGKSRGAIFVSTLSFLRHMLDSDRPLQAMARLQDEWDTSVEVYKMVHDAGAVLAVGTDSFGDSQMGALEMELLVKNCGFTPMQVITAVTKNGAEACFVGDKTGTIQKGKFADIIVVDGDPLADIKIFQEVDKIKMVMLEGTICVNRGL